MSAHDHVDPVRGCFRCETYADEANDAHTLRRDLAAFVALWLANPEPGWSEAETAVRAVTDSDFMIVTLGALIEAHGESVVLDACVEVGLLNAASREAAGR